MKKRSVFTFLLGILLLFSLASVSAQPPFQSTPEGIGLQVEYQKFEVLEIGQAFEINIHVFNASSGLRLTNETTQCDFQGYYRNGTHAAIIDLTYDPVAEDFFTVLPGAFFTGGKGSFIFYCNSTDGKGGFLSGGIDVTRTGFHFGTPQAIVYSILCFGVLILFLVCFYFMIVTPYSNKKNEKGAIIQITKLKYVKLGLIMFCWVLFTWFLNILIGLADSFVYLTMYYGFFGFMFNLMNRLALPFGILILVIAGAEIVRDSNVMKDIKKFGSSAR